MTDMTPLPSQTGEPEVHAVDDLLAPWVEKLKARGLDVPTDATPDPTPARETPEEAAARHQARLAHFATRWKSLVPVMYQEADVANLDEAQEAVRVRSWLRSGSCHLILAGPVGTGKTYAAYAVGNQALQGGLWVEAWNVGDLMDAMRPASEDRYAEDRARRCQVLILDDLPAKASDWEAERLTMLLDARVREQRQTVLTTNITSAQVTEVWGSRLMDRLNYRLTAVTLRGESRRAGAW